MFTDIGPYRAPETVVYDEDAVKREIKQLVHWMFDFLLDLRWSDYFYSAETSNLYTRAVNEFFEGSEQPGRVIENIRTASFQTLSEHGLYGQQLNAKLGLIAYWSNATYEATRSPVTTPRARRNLGFVGRKMLEILNSFFGSLMEGVPGAGAIKELKDIGESSLDLSREGRAQNANSDE